MSKKNDTLAFQKAALCFLAYNILVVLWGAWVRISFSGDGCGESWPLCQGNMIPSSASISQWVEWSHRASTGLFGVVAILLFFWSRRLFKSPHPTRLFGWAMIFFTVSEALVGAVIVKLGLVAENASVARAWVMGFHQLNSLALTASIYLLYRFSKTGPHALATLSRQSKWIAGFFAVVGFTGAIAALAGTLFPSADLISGVLADFDENSHILVRLRLSHPMIATLFCVAVVLSSLRRSASSEEKTGLRLAVIATFCIGLTTLLSLSPIWMKLVHLCSAHFVCIGIAHALIKIDASNPTN